ncbi:hypothetical protein PPSIR1_00767 [Plesiocystis pacifica SIR-1]|uniref:Uncharacterized protein n=1 Tax=Plesiocystis pacifica SIR-1 TaxID=391625 RepID=A6GJR5_9BACT|nr:hypothetical protein PPSIR1_00767 [Plesiocystis pacifica SIR-1]
MTVPQLEHLTDATSGVTGGKLAPHCVHRSASAMIRLRAIILDAAHGSSQAALPDPSHG